MHKLLIRQLKKSGLSDSKLFHEAACQNLLELVSAAYKQNDTERYTIERSIELSSAEMRRLYQTQKETAGAHIQAIANAMPDLMFLNDDEGRYLKVYASDEAKANLYIEEKQILGKTVDEVLPKNLSKRFLKTISDALRFKKLQILEYQLMIDNDEKYFEARVMPTNFKINKKDTVAIIVRNITELKISLEKLKFIAMHDPLTKLPNRTLLQDRLKLAIRRSKRTGHNGAVIFLDLDDFKRINDNHGHDIGDRVLIQMTKRIKKYIRAEDTLARIGGDEFVLLIEELDEDENIEIVIEKLHQILQKPLTINKIDFTITLSMGITLFPNDANTYTELIKYADIAMYRAKQKGKNSYCFYNKETDGV